MNEADTIAVIALLGRIETHAGLGLDLLKANVDDADMIRIALHELCDAIVELDETLTAIEGADVGGER